MGVAEVVVPPRVEEAVEDRVADHLDVAAVDAELSPFPVVVRTVVAGRVPRLVVTAEDVGATALTITTVRAELEGIEIDRAALLDGDLELERIDRGSIEATISEDDLEEALPEDVADVELTAGRVRMGVGGQMVSADAEVRDGVLALRAGGLPEVAIPLPGTELFPCALDAEVVPGAVRLGCSVDTVPQWLVRRLGGS
ncbi:MAG: LmeA family phospholipid-binding protein [Acidimicrobiales bacterium]